MAQKAYQRIKWLNSPSTDTPLNEDKLNQMDMGIDEIDDRVVNLMGYEQRVSEATEQNEEYADLSKSWAVGGSGIRDGENTNNSKYFADKAKEYAKNSGDAKLEAENARDLAEQYRDEAQSFLPTSLVERVNTLDSKTANLDLIGKIDYSNVKGTKPPTDAQKNVQSDWNATSGDALILNKPTIPSAQVQSDWNATSGVSAIKNKPTIPTNTNQLDNGAGFITGITKSMVTTALGYTPPTQDTNTTYSASTGLNLSSNAFSVKYGTTAGTACQGNDSRLSDSRKASDVYAWAKASSKPSYDITEIDKSGHFLCYYWDSNGSSNTSRSINISSSNNYSSTIAMFLVVSHLWSSNPNPKVAIVGWNAGTSHPYAKMLLGTGISFNGTNVTIDECNSCAIYQLI